jgi:hypothetical protein
MHPRLIALQRLIGSLWFGSLIAGCGGRSHSDSRASDPAPSSQVEKGLFLLGVIDMNAAACLAQPDKAAPQLPRGVMDVAFTTGYSAVVLIGNDLPQLGATAQPRSVTERVSLRAAEVTLQTADGTVLGNYSTVGTGFIDAASGGVPAYGVMVVTLIPPALGATDPVKTAHDLVAKIRVEGEALDGTTLTSTEIGFPIKVCNGCLVQYPASAVDPVVPRGGDYQCALADYAQKTPTPCALGQDEPFSCVLCSRAYSLCRDPAQNPAYPPADQ